MDNYFRSFPRVRGGSSLWTDGGVASEILEAEFFGNSGGVISVDTQVSNPSISGFVPSLIIAIATSAAVLLSTGSSPALAESLLITSQKSDLVIESQEPSILSLLTCAGAQTDIDSGNSVVFKIITSQPSLLLLSGSQVLVGVILEPSIGDVLLTSNYNTLSVKVDLGGSDAIVDSEVSSLISEFSVHSSDVLIDGYDTIVELRQPGVLVTSEAGAVTIVGYVPLVSIFKKEYIQLSFLSLVNTELNYVSLISSFKEKSLTKIAIDLNSITTVNINKKSFVWTFTQPRVI